MRVTSKSHFLALLAAVACSCPCLQIRAATALPIGPITFDTNADYDLKFKEADSRYNGISRSVNGYLELAGDRSGYAVYDTSATGGSAGTGGLVGNDVNNDLANMTISADISSSSEGKVDVGFLMRLNNSESNGYCARVKAVGMTSVLFSLFEGASISSLGTLVAEQTVHLSSGSLTPNTIFTFSVTAVDGRFSFDFGSFGSGAAIATLIDDSVTATTGQVGIVMGAYSRSRLDNFRIALALAGKPSVATGVSSLIATTSATIGGTVNPNRLATTARFEYGLTTSYGSIAYVPLSPVNGSSAQVVSASITGLITGTTYHYRLVANNSQGTSIGSDLTFTTASPLPRTLINNGSFENGLTDWIISDLAVPFIAVQAAPNGYCPGSDYGFFASAATDGVMSAVHGFDGSPGVIGIAQEVLIPWSTPYLVFNYRAAWDMTSSGATLPRIFRVVIQSSGGGATLLSTTILTAAAGTKILDTGPLTGVVDLTSFAGSVIRIIFETEVPQPSTGPGFFQLDNVGFAAVMGPAAVAPLNGGFETGDLTGWASTTTNASCGNWSVYAGSATPLPSPPEGTFGAATNQSGPSTQILYKEALQQNLWVNFGSGKSPRV